MAPNIAQSGTVGRNVLYTGRESRPIGPIGWKVSHSAYPLPEDDTMLKRIMATTAVLALCALPLAAQGHAATPGNEMTLTGQVIDLNCHTTNGAIDRKSTRLNSVTIRSRMPSSA